MRKFKKNYNRKTKKGALEVIKIVIIIIVTVSILALVSNDNDLICNKAESGSQQLEICK